MVLFLMWVRIYIKVWSNSDIFHVFNNMPISGTWIIQKLSHETKQK